MNIVILTNEKNYTYHKKVSSFLKSCLRQMKHDVSLLDINSAKYPHQCLQKLSSLQPDVTVTLDLAGFQFRTEAGENALNMLLTKNLNLVWGNRPEYAPFLSKKVSLSMLFYDVSQDSSFPADAYPNVLFVKAPGMMLPDCKTPEDETHNQNLFELIWKDFLEETLLMATCPPH